LAVWDRRSFSIAIGRKAGAPADHASLDSPLQTGSFQTFNLDDGSVMNSDGHLTELQSAERLADLQNDLSAAVFVDSAAANWSLSADFIGRHRRSPGRP
jgi:hypothetical protein